MTPTQQRLRHLEHEHAGLLDESRESEELTEPDTPLEHYTNFGLKSPHAPSASPRYQRPSDLSRLRKAFIMISLYIVTFFYGVDSTVVSTLATDISSGFNQLHRAAWLNTSYLLAITAVGPLYGRLGDLFGRRIAIALGLSLFTLGCALCGLSTSMSMLVVARLVQGIGGGGSGLIGSIIISDIMPLKDRGIYSGIGAVFYACGAGFGAPFGGVIADSMGWRWAFLSQVPLLIFIMLCLVSCTTYRVPGQVFSLRAARNKIDWAGAFLLVIWIGALVLAMAFKTNEGYPFDHPLVYGTALLSAITFALFMYVELHYAVDPVVSMRLLQDPARLAIVWATFMSQAAGVAVALFFPMLLQIVRHNAPGIAGLHMMPNTLARAIGGVIAGVLISKTGRYYHSALVFAIIPAIPSFLMAGLTERTYEFITWLALIPGGLGNAGFGSIAFIALLNTVGRADVAAIASLNALFRSAGQVIGLAMSSAVQQVMLERELHKNLVGPDAALIIEEVRRNATAIVALDPEMRVSATKAFASSLHATFILDGLLAIACFVWALRMREKPLSDMEDDMEESKAMLDDEYPMRGVSVEE